MAKRKKAKRRTGRPTKLTPWLIGEICGDLASGVGTVEDICLAKGISEPTFYRWKQQAEHAETGLFREFREGLDRAQAQRRIRWEARLEKAGEEDWRALSRLMEMSNPRRYAPRVRVHVEQELSDVLDRLKAKLPTDQYEQVLSAIAGEHGGGSAEGDSGPENRRDHQQGGQAVQPPHPER